MCAQFVLKVKANDLAKKLGMKFPQPLPEEFDIRPRGFMKTDLAPVVIVENGELVLKEMSFSLCPNWSPTFPYSYSTYNARLTRPKFTKDKKPVIDPKTKKQVTECIFNSPAFRDSFVQGRTCLVPMNLAIESSYFGSHAGQIIQFANSDESVFFCVGLWDQWVDKKTGEVKESFTLLTDDPYEYFFDAGHDRSVFVIEDSAFKDWMFGTSMKKEERFDFLRSHRISLDWKVTTERQMAKGWEKKAPKQDEIDALTVWRPKKVR